MYYQDIPAGVFITSGCMKCYCSRFNSIQKNTMHKALVCCKRRVIKSPVTQIVFCSVLVPLLHWSMNRDFHPMPLSFIVSIFGRHCSTCKNKIQDLDKFRIWASTEAKGDPYLLMLKTTLAKREQASRIGLRVRESRIMHIEMPQQHTQSSHWV